MMSNNNICPFILSIHLSIHFFFSSISLCLFLFTLSHPLPPFVLFLSHLYFHPFPTLSFLPSLFIYFTFHLPCKSLFAFIIYSSHFHAPFCISIVIFVMYSIGDDVINELGGRERYIVSI